MWQVIINGPGYFDTAYDLPEGTTYLGRADNNDIVLSGDHGCIKPEERFYRIALERIDLPRQSLVFVDDNPRNLRGAELIGLRGLLFTGADNLRRDLTTLGVPLATRA